MVNKTAFLSTSYLISAKSIYHPKLEVENVINRSTVKDELYLCLEQFPLHLSSPAACPPITQGKKIKYSDCYYLFRGHKKKSNQVNIYPSEKKPSI